MIMAKVLITGGTGLIGTALCSALISSGFEVTILTRHLPKTKMNGLDYALWDPAAGKIDVDALSGSDFIVQLAGANVAEGRWTKKRKKEIIDSRVETGRLLVRSLVQYPNKVRAV